MAHGAESFLARCPEPQSVRVRGIRHRGWPSERTALAGHRRRVRGRRRASRKTGVIASLTAVAAAFAVVVAAAVYLVGVRPGSGDSMGAVAAVVAVPTSHTVALLEKQREQLIAFSAASRTLSLVGQPKLASRQQSALSSSASGSPGSTTAGPPAPPPDPGTAQSIAYNMMSSFGFSPQTQFSCLNNIWTRESGWIYNAENPSGAYGIPQALPGSKMASAGADWMTNPATQIKWGLGYIQARYGTPCDAWAFWQLHSYY
jgi:hypothetical protein